MAEALRVPAHLAGRVPASQAASPPSHSTLTGAELPQARKSCIYAGRVASFMSNSLHPCRLWPARLLCQEGSPGKNTGACWPIQVAIPFWSTIFPAALAANPPEYLMLPEPLRPKQLHHLRTWPSRDKPKSSRAASGAKPQWTTHMQRWK